MSFPSFGDTQPSCHPVASKKHSSNHLVLSAEVQGTARERKEEVSTFVTTGGGSRAGPCMPP